MALAPAIALFTFVPAGANPWLQEPGRAEVISGSSFVENSAGLIPGAVPPPDRTFDLRIDYGFDRWTAIGQVTTQGDAQGNLYFSMAVAGARFRLKRWDYTVLSAQILAGGAGVRSAGADTSVYGTGEARLLFGHGFALGAYHAFAGLEAGARWRGGDPADELLLDITAGIEPWKTGLLMAQTFSIFGAGKAHGNYRRYDLHKLQLSFAQSLDDSMWLQLGVTRVLAGADAGQNGAIASIWWRF